MDYAEFYRRSIEQPDAFWAEQAQLIDWQRPFESVCDDSRAPFTRWFEGGQTNLCHNAVDRHLAELGEQSALIWVSTEVEREITYTLQPTACAGATPGRRAAVVRGQARRPGAAVHADDSASRVRDARVCAHRRDPFGRVRRFRQRQPGQSDRQRHAEGDPQRRRRQPWRQGDAVQGLARRGHHAGQTQARQGADGRPRPGAVRSRAGARRGLRGAVRPASKHRRAVRLARCHASELHAVHQRHHRHAEGRAARHRRLRGGAGGEHEAHLLRPARRDLLFDQRHRLGRRPQLHRLRAADRGHGDDPLRRTADPTGPRHLVATGREIQGDGDVQRADGRPGAEEAGPGLAEEVRSVEPACAVPCRRAAGRTHRQLDQRVTRHARSSTTTGRPRAAGRS